MSKTKKKQNSKNSTSRAMNLLLASLIILVLTVIGSWGFNALRDRSSRAEAEAAESAPEAAVDPEAEATAESEAEGRNNLKYGWKTLDPTFYATIKIRMCKHQLGPRTGLKVWAKAYSGQGRSVVAYMTNGGPDSDSNIGIIDGSALRAGKTRAIGGYRGGSVNPYIRIVRYGEDASRTQNLRFKSLPRCPD